MQSQERISLNLHIEVNSNYDINHHLLETVNSKPLGHSKKRVCFLKKRLAGVCLKTILLFEYFVKLRLVYHSFNSCNFCKIFVSIDVYCRCSRFPPVFRKIHSNTNLLPAFKAMGEAPGSRNEGLLPHFAL